MIDEPELIPVEDIEFAFKATQFIPLQFQGEPDDIGKMFDGKIPEVGDLIEVICYEVIEKEGKLWINCKWRVKGEL